MEIRIAEERGVRVLASIRLSIDGVTLITVSTDDFESVDVHVAGSRTKSQFAHAMVSAMRHVDSVLTYFSWNELELRPGQTISVSFDEHGSTQPQGLTFAERFAVPLPYNEQIETREEMAARIRSMPSLRDSYKFTINGVTETFCGETQNNDHSFLFIANWQSLPMAPLPSHLALVAPKTLERQLLLRVRLIASTVENLEKGTIGTRLYDACFPIGGQVDLKLS